MLEAINAAQGYHAYSFTGNDSLDLLVESVQITFLAWVCDRDH